MKLFLVLALLSLTAADRWYDYTERRRPRTEPTTQPRIVRDYLDIDAWDIRDNIEDHKEPVNGRDHYWDDDVSDPVIKHVIPEMCYLTSNNCTVYNSFLLDCNSVKEFERVSPECSNFKCEAVHYFLEHGGDIYAKVLRAESIKEAVQIFHKELTSIFDDLNICTCGKEFLRAFFRASPFYNGNFLTYHFRYESDMVQFQRVLRMLDFKSLSKIFDGLIDGICAETRSGKCLNSIFTGLEEVAEMVENTIADYEDYDDGDSRYQKQQEKRCDAMFGPISAWEKSEIDLGYMDEIADIDDITGEDAWQNFFEKTSVFMDSLYCDKGCKKERRSSSIYPCCMQTMLEDKKLFNAMDKFVVSVYKALPATSLEYSSLYIFSSTFTKYEGSDLEERMAWTLPDPIQDAFMQTIHAAKYCPGRKMKCSDNSRPEA